jgi:hypothetical protein
MVDKRSGQVTYVVISGAGFLSLGLAKGFDRHGCFDDSRGIEVAAIIPDVSGLSVSL